MANNPTEQCKTNSSGPAMSAELKTQTLNQNKINLQEKNKDQISNPNSSINKTIGTKRPVPVSPTSPSVSNHLVYVRRKLENEKNEQGKIVNCNVGKDETVIIKEENVEIGENEKKMENEENEKKLENEKNDGKMINSPIGKDEMVIEEQILQNEKNEENEHGKMIDSPIGKDETVVKEQNLQNVENEKLMENEKNEHGKVINSPIGKDEIVNKEQTVQNMESEEIRENEKNEHGKMIDSLIRKDETVTKEQNLQNVEKQKNEENQKNEKNVVKNKAEMKPKEDWKERFLRLQTFLRNLDQSNQDEYMRTLRSLSAVGRSKHAVELEKRAIHLLLEEGKELHRMKILNVLGKNTQTEPQLSSPVLTQMER